MGATEPFHPSGHLSFNNHERIFRVGYFLFLLSIGGYAGAFQGFMHVYVITAAVILLPIASLTLIMIRTVSKDLLPTWHLRNQGTDQIYLRRCRHRRFVKSNF
jgi:hypothetical protein